MPRCDSLVRAGCGVTCGAAIVIGSLAGGCASSSELVTIRNDSASAERMAVVFGIRSGLAPTGLVVGPGALCRTLAPGECWTASAEGGESLLPTHSALSATTIMVRPPAHCEWIAFLVPWGDRDSREARGGRHVCVTVHAEPDGYRVEATDQYFRILGVTPVEPSTAGDAAAMVRRWMRELR